MGHVDWQFLAFVIIPFMGADQAYMFVWHLKDLQI
jgi:hypothetical protein